MYYKENTSNKQELNETDTFYLHRCNMSVALSLVTCISYELSITTCVMTQTQEVMNYKLIIETMIYSLEEVKGKSNCNIIITMFFDI